MTSESPYPITFSEEEAIQPDTLSALLDSLDVSCSSIEEVTILRSQENCIDDIGPVFYVVTQGTCRIAHSDVKLTGLGVGDFLMLPHGGKHRLSHVSSTSLPCLDKTNSQETPSTEIDKNGESVLLLCGHLKHLTLRPHPLWLDLPRVIHLNDFDNTATQPVLAAAIHGIQSLLSEPKEGAGSIMNILGKLLIVEAIRRTIASREFVHPGLMCALNDPELAFTMTLVYQDPAREWTLESLAHEAGMSRSSLARRFKGLMGIPPMEWITDIRMRRACSLLVDQSSGIKNVAAQVGYASAASFSTAFKRWSGKVPSECRAALPGK